MSQHYWYYQQNNQRLWIGKKIYPHTIDIQSSPQCAVLYTKEEIINHTPLDINKLQSTNTLD